MNSPSRATVIELFVAAVLLVAAQPHCHASSTGLSADGRPITVISRNLDSYALAPPSPWFGDLDGMRKRHMIRVLVPYSRTYYFLYGGRQLGMTYQAIRTFKEWLNRKDSSTAVGVHVVFIPVARDKLLPGLGDGLGDIAAGKLLITTQRERQVNFVVAQSRVRILVVTGPQSPKLSSIQDLSGKTICVRRSSSYVEYLTALNGEFKHQGLAEIELKAIDENLEDEDILEMVGAGLLPATVVDEPTAKLWAKMFSKLVVREDLIIKDNLEFGWAVRTNSPLLLAAIGDFGQSHRVGTTFGNDLLRRYHAAKFVRNAAASRDRRRFEGVVHIFRKYSALYNFDYLMLAALGYQESHLNQKQQSKRGAVGVMQILPSTASNPPISVRNVRINADANIMAGTKYLRMVVDEYLNDPKIDNQNRILMAFAAYNAGPGNLRKVRRVARDSGLNENIWFDNVEIAAARTVGDETVDYVRNIYKYYVAYKLLTEREQERKEARQAHQLSP